MNILTFEEVRDRIAELEGWSPPGTPFKNVAGVEIFVHQWLKFGPNGETLDRNGYESAGPNGPVWGKHPIPDTLDEAAKLPDGYTSIICVPAWADAPGKRWTASWQKDMNSQKIFAVSEVSEIDARFRLRLAVLEYMKENA